ncbi:VWA domain-containing protein [Pseudomonas saudiphocaensis]|uniref:VWA domain-containing protein n=1 Tax=Pseudomonas saudiphocaensis TaxID=1499686 RepID=UPI000F7B1A70|nr:VWA domain-containing protein [Pseudomonas saudiphocaensis]RRV16051.1 VWA domain-containing protein [Pseudomonas saudiphocaensis]
MIDLWPHLLRPYWLLLVPLPIWLLWRLWHLRRRTGNWQRLLPEAFHQVLLTKGKSRSSRLPWLLLGCAWLLACLALLGPSWQQVEQPGLSRDDPLVILLDLTPAMLAADLQPTRLEHAKRKILDLLQARQDAQTAVVVFAGSAHTLVPLTRDLATTRNLLDALHPSLMPATGQRADLAVAQGITLLEHGARGRGRLLLIGSDLNESERDSIQAQLKDAGLRLLILGIGTRQGAPVASEDGSFLKDDQGAILIPQLDDSTLRRFANDTGGRYQQSRLDAQDLRSLGLLERGGSRQARDNETTQLDLWLDQGYWLLLPLLLLAACGGRRGWLLCLPLLIALPQPASAVSLNDLWARPDQQGMRLLEQNRPGEAAEHFEDYRWQGFARYQAGDYAGAAERFAQGDTASDHYNRGNALARNEQYESAIEAYDQALELAPGLQAAQHNKALVEELLRQREQQAQESESPQEGAEDEASPEQSPATGGAAGTQVEAATDTETQAGDEQNEPTQPADQSFDDTTEAGANVQPVRNEDALADPEQNQALEQWLRKVPDNPGELLRRKFLLEYRKHQE